MPLLRLMPGDRKGQCHSNKKNIAKGGARKLEGGVPALLTPERGKGAFDDTGTEAEATGSKPRLGLSEVDKQALTQAGQLAGLHQSELIAGRIQHMQGMGKTEAIRIQAGLQG